MTIVFLMFSLVRSQNSKVFFKRPRRWRVVKLSRQNTWLFRVEALYRICGPLEVVGTFTRCCEAWKLVDIDFQEPSQIFVQILRNAKLRSRISRWHKRKKTMLESDAEVDNVPGVTKELVLFLSVVTDEECHPSENEDESGRRLCEYWRTIFQARVEGSRHHQNEEILRYELDDLLLLKKDSALGPGGIPYGAYRCVGGLARNSSLNAYSALWEGNTVPEYFAESRTVLIPKTSDIDDNGRISRSFDALRLYLVQLRLQISYICHKIFEIGATQKSGIPLADLAAAYPSVNHSWIFFVLENIGLSGFLCRFLRSIYKDSITHVEFAGANRGHFFLWSKVYETVVQWVVFSMVFDPMF